MTRNKDQKRIIRRRMQKTGEAYTAARAQVLSKARRPQPPPPAVDLGALAGITDDAIRAKTGRAWHEWVRVLDAEEAAARPHGEIAAIVHGTHGVGEWWAQAVTVGYERIKGLREKGQRRGGLYEVSKSRTFAVPLTALFEAWAADAARRKWLDRVETRVRTAVPPKSMRLQWPDGTIVAAWFTPKGDAKSAVAVAHTKLRDRTAADAMKLFWTARLNSLAALLETAPRAPKTVRKTAAAKM